MSPCDCRLDVGENGLKSSTNGVLFPNAMVRVPEAPEPLLALLPLLPVDPEQAARSRLPTSSTTAAQAPRCLIEVGLAMCVMTFLGHWPSRVAS